MSSSCKWTGIKITANPSFPKVCLELWWSLLGTQRWVLVGTQARGFSAPLSWEHIFFCQMWHSSFAKEGNWMATSDFQPPKRPRLAVSKSREPEPASCPGWTWVMTQYLPRDLMAWNIFLVPLSVPDGDGGTHRNVCATPEGHWSVLAHLSEAWPHLFYCLPSDTPCLSVFSLLHSFFCKNTLIINLPLWGSHECRRRQSWV